MHIHTQHLLGVCACIGACAKCCKLSLWSLSSNLAFGLLGHCLVPHFYPNMTYEEYIEQNLLQPLGMSSTGFNYTSRHV